VTGGIYQPDYVDGISAGSIAVSANYPVLEATMEGGVYIGSKQRQLAQSGTGGVQSSPDQLPQGASLSINIVNSNNMPNGVSVVLDSTAPDIHGNNVSYNSADSFFPGLGGSATQKPVTLTLSVCVGWIVFGLISVTCGTPAITVNAVVTTCDPVVMVMFRDPVVATLSMVIGTDALVGPLTVTVPVVMSAPKLTVVVDPKLVSLPVITIVSLDPWCADDGLSVAAAVIAPVPESAISSGLGLAVLVTVSEPTMDPAMVGAN